jgi:outer membrane lipoprotein LolB
LLVALLLAGCVSAPRPPPNTSGADIDELALTAAPWPLRRERLQALSQFRCDGRVAIAAGGEGLNARFEYQQRGAEAELQLQAPFGVGGFRAIIGHEDLQVRWADGRRLDGAEAQAEIERRLGVALPLKQLRYWLLGVGAPESATLETLRATGPAQLERLQQGDWTANYTLHTGLPRQVELRGGNARLRLVLERWDLTP